MAVFRMEKHKDYTIMANHHLRNKSLSLKAKGLLSLMLSLPEDWDYTTRGLAYICKEGVDSIRSTVKELEQAGYLQRRRIRNDKGQLTETEYTILEFPQPPEPDAPDQGNPEPENPVLDEPVQEAPEQAAPGQEEPTQLNTYKPITYKSNTYSPITPSILPPLDDGRIDVDTKRQEIREQIDYDYLRTLANAPRLDELVEIMLEVMLTRSPTIRIGRNAQYPTAFVQERFSQLTGEHIQHVLDSLGENTARVRNTKAYLLAALFNAPATMDNHFAMLVNHDLYGAD
jgi:hypothetical protein